MLNKKESDDAPCASIKKEMAKPRMAKSARTAGLNLDTERVPGQPGTTLPGTVHKIIGSLRTTQPEKAQIAVAGGHHQPRDLRIENTLADRNGQRDETQKGYPR